jgi:hypothetical protein
MAPGPVNLENLILIIVVHTKVGEQGVLKDPV